MEKVKVEIREPEFTLQVLRHINNRYKDWADYAAYHVTYNAKGAKKNIDIYHLLEDVTSKLIRLKQKKLARLFYNPGFGGCSRLDLWVLKQIKKKIVS